MHAFSIQARRQMRMNLKVSFAEKDEAKKLGAKWDPTRKVWYVQDGADMSRFSKWSATPHEDSASDAVTKKSLPASRQTSAGMDIVGSEYVERPRVCNCLPWDVCEKCEATAF